MEGRKMMRDGWWKKGRNRWKESMAGIDGRNRWQETMEGIEEEMMEGIEGKKMVRDGWWWWCPSLHTLLRLLLGRKDEVCENDDRYEITTQLARQSPVYICIYIHLHIYKKERSE